MVESSDTGQKKILLGQQLETMLSELQKTKSKPDRILKIKEYVSKGWLMQQTLTTAEQSKKQSGIDSSSSKTELKELIASDPTYQGIQFQQKSVEKATAESQNEQTAELRKIQSNLKKEETNMSELSADIQNMILNFNTLNEGGRRQDKADVVDRINKLTSKIKMDNKEYKDIKKQIDEGLKKFSEDDPRISELIGRHDDAIKRHAEAIEMYESAVADKAEAVQQRKEANESAKLERGSMLENQRGMLTNQTNIKESLGSIAADQAMQGNDIDTMKNSMVEIKQIIADALKSQEGKNFAQVPLFRSALPDVTDQIQVGGKVDLSDETLKKLEKIMIQTNKSNDPSARFKLNQFIKKVGKHGLAKYIESENKFNRQTSGIPNVQNIQPASMPNKNSSNGTVAVNNSGLIPYNREHDAYIYNVATGKAILTPGTYKDKKEKFLKEAYYTAISQTPEVRKKAHFLLQALEQHYARKSVGKVGAVLESLKDNYNAQAVNQQKRVNPIFEESEEQKEVQIDTGKKASEAIQRQNRRMEARFEDGLQHNTSAFNQQIQRDPGQVYQDTFKPDYTAILPDIHKIVISLANQKRLTRQQLEFAVLTLDDKDPFEVLSNIHYLNQQLAKVPMKSKDQVQIKREANAIAKRLGSNTVYFPYNEKEIALLQGFNSGYYDNGGKYISQPVLKKSVYEARQKKELEGVRKDIKELYGPKDQNQNQQMGELSIEDYVSFAHQLIDYVSKIEGNINPGNLKLQTYQAKTTVFQPQVKKLETTDFQFTAESAFKLRPC